MENYINKNSIETKIYAETLEDEARRQIHELADCNAYSDSKIRIMPDAHAGKGCVVGTTIKLTDKVCPNTVGVDLNCGMLVYSLNKCPDFEKLDKFIRKHIPNGRNVHDAKDAIFFDLSELKCFEGIGPNKIDWAERSLGTLGGGNHFIELDKDDVGNIYLVIHCGSRNLGLQVCNYYQNLAIKKLESNEKSVKETIKRLKKEHRDSEIQSTIRKIGHKTVSNKDLAYIEGEDLENYLHDIKIVAQFAHMNRQKIAEDIANSMGLELKFVCETLHNYIDTDTNTLRKGAVRANSGELLIIPMNMRDGSLICRGLGNADWNYSAPHGAGRLMSRKKAKETLVLSDYKKEMKNVVSWSVSEKTIDEAPDAYKSSEEIKRLITPTVEIMKTIHSIYNFKAEE